MKLFFFLTIFCCQLASTFAQTYKLRLGIFDCINCNAYLVLLKKEIKNRPIQIILPESYQYDKDMIISKYRLNEMNLTFNFSDKEFYRFDSPKSYLIKVNSKGEEEATILSDVDFATLFSKDSIQNKCINEVKNYYSFSEMNNGLLLKNIPLGKFAVYDWKQGVTLQFFADNNTAMQNYMSFYEENFSSWYELYKIYSNAYPMVQTRYEDIVGSNTFENEIFLISSSTIIVPPKSGTDTHGVNMNFLNWIINFTDLSQSKSLVIPNNGLPDGYSFKSQLLINNQDFIFPLLYKYEYDNNVKILAKYYLNREDSVLEFSSMLPFTIPETYIEYKLNFNFNTYLQDKQLITLSFSNVVYDCQNLKTYQIWDVRDSIFKNLSLLKNDKKNNYEGFSILDIKDGENNDFYILYLDNYNKVTCLTYSKESKKIINEKIILQNFHFQDYDFVPSFDKFNKDFVLIKKKGDNCFQNINF